jgi:hypothetical protein
MTMAHLKIVTVLVLALTGPAVAQVTYQGQVTGAGGSTVGATGSAGYDPATGRTRSTTLTNDNGGSATRNVTADCAASGMGTANCTRSSTMNGNSRTATRTLGDGQAGHSVIRQGANGRMATRWITVTP